MAALTSDRFAYRGFLYFGLMLTSAGPKVLEFNCRLGDPETEAIVVQMNFDLGEVLAAVADGKLRSQRLNWYPGASVCVVMTSGGYPGKYATGKEIHGLEETAAMTGVSVFHAGTKREGFKYYTSSGRVLGITALDDSLDAARRRAYDAVQLIRFSNCHYRGDIALDGCRVANVGKD
jgi:phosphoribosylamine--glycine ligase